jgi:hypothetical protein
VLSIQKDIPLNLLCVLNFLFFEIHGIISSFNDLLANMAPASIMLATLYDYFKLKMVFKKRYHGDC